MACSADGRRCVQRCLSQLQAAEEALSQVRGSLSALTWEGAADENEVVGPWRVTVGFPAQLTSGRRPLDDTAETWAGFPLQPRAGPRLHKEPLRVAESLGVEQAQGDLPAETGVSPVSAMAAAGRLRGRAPTDKVVAPSPPASSDGSVLGGAESPRASVLSAFARSPSALRIVPPGMFVDQVIVGSVNVSLKRKGAREVGCLITGAFDDPAMDATGTSSTMHETITGIQEVVGLELPSPALFNQDVTWRRMGATRIKVPMFHPESNIRLLWMLLGFVFIMYEVLAIPVYIAFDVSPEGVTYALESIINCYFIGDIVVQFLSSHLDPSGNVVADPLVVGSRYCRTWLLPDLIASTPWEWIPAARFGQNEVTRGVRVFRSIRMLRLLRLVRLMKLGSIMSAFEARLESNHVYLFVFGATQIACLLAAICHWSACIWYGIGTGEHYGQNYDNGEPMTWVIAYQHTYPYMGEDKVAHYVYALYFCLTTMATVGYGDIAPRNYNEVRFTMVLVILASICFANMMGTLTNLLASLNHRNRILLQKKVTLSRYLHFRTVPWKLFMSIRHHLLFMWEANEGYDRYEDELKAQLTPILKQELCHHVYGKMLTSAPFLVWMKDYPACTKHLAEKIRPLFVTPGDQVFRMGEPNEMVYILLRGKVVISRIEHLYDQDYETRGPLRKAATNVSLGGAARQSARDSVANVATSFTRMLGSVVLPPKKLSGRLGDFTNQETSLEEPEVMQLATLELQLTDIRRRVAARKVQRMWRIRVNARASQEGGNGQTIAKNTLDQWLRKERMNRRRVLPPAYFGESCLWQPFEEWGRTPPPVYMYTVRVETPGELACFERSAVKEMLERYSPWIPERLEMFQEVVHRKLEQMMQADATFKHLVVDWAYQD